MADAHHGSGTAADAPIVATLMALPIPGVCLEYVWLTAACVAGECGDMRSKCRVVREEPLSVRDVARWRFDGEGTDQSPGVDTEVVLEPVLMAADPFRGHPHKLILCQCLKQDGTPIASNTRDDSLRYLRAKPDTVPWFGIEQEVTLFEMDKRTPLGWPRHGVPEADSVYCAVGVDVKGRSILEAQLRACLFAGLKISGTNLECMTSMIEYQVGPLEGIACADHLWLSRYILCRICESMNVHCSFDPKPVEGFSGAGAHTNFSTKAMRDEGGLDAILAAVEKLASKHKEHIAVYGVGNEERLTGTDDAPGIECFSFGVATRAGSVRIPRECERSRRGYLEDRRPAANMDPYQVMGKMFKTTVLE